jgi:hypothetical protein
VYFPIHLCLGVVSFGAGTVARIFCLLRALFQDPCPPGLARLAKGREMRPVDDSLNLIVNTP